ncbi:MAG: hypothetical protein EAZ08_12665 [Cytophagales bacterium]|nr:MAG: hypothetical protein EAZ08_12665 [Cytophagales bacterium]
MKEDLFFLPLFITEKIYVIAKDEEVGIAHLADLPKQETKPFLILHEENSLPVAQEELLANILKAVSISSDKLERLFIGDFQPINLASRKFIFVFSSAKIPPAFAQIEKNKAREITEGTQVIYSDSLTDLAGDKQKKLALWAELKRTFSL